MLKDLLFVVALSELSRDPSTSFFSSTERQVCIYFISLSTKVQLGAATKNSNLKFSRFRFFKYFSLRVVQISLDLLD